MAGALYVVATPVGNLADITCRAVETLSHADFIMAEDTRVTKVLLDRYNIKKPLFSCHKYNEKTRLDFFLHEIFNGKSAALVSDAGTPCISDPGHILIARAVKEGIDVIPVGGISSVTAALSVSGFDIKSFAFYGFPPKKISEVKIFFETVKNDSQRTAVFFESPKRIVKCLETMVEIFSGAEACLCNDLTKKFEKIYRGGIVEVADELKQNHDREKGEYTLVLYKGAPETDEKIVSDEQIIAMLEKIIAERGCTHKEAVNILAAEKKGALRKKDIYAAALKMKGGA